MTRDAEGEPYSEKQNREEGGGSEVRERTSEQGSQVTFLFQLAAPEEEGESYGSPGRTGVSLFETPEAMSKRLLCEQSGG